MKALTLWQPWAQIVVRGLKLLENRPWRLPASAIDVDVAIHAGKFWDENCVRKVNDFWPSHGGLKEAIHDARDRMGGVVGVVRFTANITYAGDARIPLGHDAWYSGPNAFVIKDPREALAFIPCRGAQLFWPLPEDVEFALKAAMP